MKTLICALFTAGTLAAQEIPAKQEVGLTLGAITGFSRSGGPAKLDFGSGVALQANYAYRLAASDKAALYGEVHFLANGQRLVNSSTRSLTRDVATAYVTPGIRVKFVPVRAVSPYLVAGGGYALYEQSYFQIDGESNAAPRFTHRGAFDFGGGVDFRFWRFVGLRAELRDFYSGSPNYNNPQIRGGQHNLVAGGGIVLKFGAR